MGAQTPKADKKDTDMRATVNDLVPVFYVLNFLDGACFSRRPGDRPPPPSFSPRREAARSAVG